MLLVGPAGSGKTTYAKAHFAPTEILSSDAFRGMVSDDEGDQSATPAAFSVLHRVADARLRRGLLTVIDATNLLPRPRARLRAMADRHRRAMVAIVFDVPLQLLLERAAGRPGRPVPREVVIRQRRLFESTLAALPNEGFHSITRP